LDIYLYVVGGAKAELGQGGNQQQASNSQRSGTALMICTQVVTILLPKST
jgi:hypothetical protein